MRVHVESKADIIERKTDSRGRVYLGTEYADREVQIAVLDAADSDNDDEN